MLMNVFVRGREKEMVYHDGDVVNENWIPASCGRGADDDDDDGAGASLSSFVSPVVHFGSLNRQRANSHEIRPHMLAEK